MISVLALAVLAPKPTYYLAFDRLVLGSLRDHKWTRLETVTNKKMRMTFTNVGIGKTNGSYVAKGLMKGGPNDAGYLDGPTTDASNGILFSGPVSISSPIKTLSNSNEAYIAVVQKYLKSKGIKSNARITKAVMGDLDGNGTQEVIIVASNRDNLTDEGMHGSNSADYSLVLLRYERNGKAVEQTLAFDHAQKDGMNYENRLEAIADFDGDGVMEVVVSNHYYEGESAMVFRYKGTSVKKVLEMGDGV